MPSDILTFNRNPYDAIICIDGELPERSFFEIFKGIKLIAADGAANKLLKLGIKPDLVIGDLDSINQNVKEDKSIEKLKLEDQDSNDFEKSLKWCFDNYLTDALVTGFHGGELEHTLNNWSVFKRYSKILEITIYDLGRYGFSISKSTEINLESGELVSLIPQTKAKIITNGLKWNLNNEILKLGIREGARNQTISNKITLEILEGEILFFCKARLPLKPIRKK